MVFDSIEVNGKKLNPHYIEVKTSFVKDFDAFIEKLKKAEKENYFPEEDKKGLQMAYDAHKMLKDAIKTLDHTQEFNTDLLKASFGIYK